MTPTLTDYDLSVRFAAEFRGRVRYDWREHRWYILTTDGWTCDVGETLINERIERWLDHMAGETGDERLRSHKVRNIRNGVRFNEQIVFSDVNDGLRRK